MLFRGPTGGGAASGKLGAMVASHNAGGQYLRSRVTPRNPKTTLQSAIRISMSAVSATWQTLSTAARSAWKAYGIAVPSKNRLGDSISLSGIAAFNRCNIRRHQAGFPIVTVAPDTMVGSPAFGDFIANFSYGSTTGTLVLAGSQLPLDSGSNGVYTLYTSPPFSLGRTSPPSQRRLALTLAGTATAGSYSFTLPFSAGASSNQMAADLILNAGDGRTVGPFPLTFKR